MGGKTAKLFSINNGFIAFAVNMTHSKISSMWHIVEVMMTAVNMAAASYPHEKHKRNIKKKKKT